MEALDQLGQAHIFEYSFTGIRRHSAAASHVGGTHRRYLKDAPRLLNLNQSLTARCLCSRYLSGLDRLPSTPKTMPHFTWH